MIPAYVQRLQRLAAEAERNAAARQPNLIERVAAVVGDGTTARIPELQRALAADPRAVGAALRALGYRRRRVWSGEDYALTRWERVRK